MPEHEQGVAVDFISGHQNRSPFRKLAAVGALVGTSIAVGGNTTQADTTPANSSECIDVSAQGFESGDIVDVTSVVVQPEGRGWVALRKSDDIAVYKRPTGDRFSSNNFQPGDLNTATSRVEVGSDNQICADIGDAAGKLIVDLAGGFKAEDNAYTAIEPTRLFDGREDGTTPANSSECFDVSAHGFSSGDTVDLTSVVVQPDGRGWIAFRPSDDIAVYKRPTGDRFSSNNFQPGDLNTATSRVEVGSDNQACADIGDAAGKLIVDLAGGFKAEAGAYTAIEPTRLFDGRVDGATPANSSECFDVSAHGFSSGDTVDLTSVVVQPDGRGWIAFRPSDDIAVYKRPANERFSSNNFQPGDLNTATSRVEVGSDNQACADIGDAAGKLIVDLAGGFKAEAGAYTAIEPTRLFDGREEKEKETLTQISSNGSQAVNLSSQPGAKNRLARVECLDYRNPTRSEDEFYYRIIRFMIDGLNPDTDASLQNNGSVIGVDPKLITSDGFDTTYQRFVITPVYANTDSSGKAVAVMTLDGMHETVYPGVSKSLNGSFKILHWLTNDSASFPISRAQTSEFEVNDLPCELQPKGSSPFTSDRDNVVRITAQVGRHPLTEDAFNQSYCNYKDMGGYYLFDSRMTIQGLPPGTEIGDSYTYYGVANGSGFYSVPPYPTTDASGIYSVDSTGLPYYGVYPIRPYIDQMRTQQFIKTIIDGEETTILFRRDQWCNLK